MTETRQKPELRCTREGALGIITLDRQEALNALSHEMVVAMSRQLAAWHRDPQVAAVLVKPAPGRAFCAGGDVRTVNEVCRREGIGAATPFFHDEYRLNWRIKHFGKPYISLLDGVTMGGGVGISVHGTHRVLTERILFAMPETGIGFFPDVGGSYFLPRCPGASGTWMALTGARLHAADCRWAGIGTHFVPSDRLEELEARLVAARGVELPGELEAALAEFGEAPEPAPLAERRALIDRCFAADSAAQAVAALEAEDDGWAHEQAALIRRKSPLATAVTHAQLRRGAELDFDACMAMEYRMVHHFLENGEFYEGVRALLIDKDKNPRWAHARLEDVPEGAIEEVFAALPQGDLAFDWQGV
ncbi:enoyl-CoA hydratase/isomerase family protein [Marinimicrococcus flavescens]|uniref:3-hydroxyisobutyryl-CoA hydrolase n=1 Tax=Marinimicrococcus flavescens TaxID=3031815 RepID=A0AAP3V2L9_9PROT|nr:enoyl-CoA hydratase/isomerase family protein [Marinimicrococcus flavescens]